jgi:putative Mg2+ transporter-C (MgtC) family protein
MLAIFDGIRDYSLLAVAVRMLLATFCGGLIGIERAYKRRPAGFRTHILICLGASMTTLTSQYLLLEMHYYTDIGRLGAQVIAGIGFIGAGAIIVTRRRRVKGLTTAAGLWTAAIIGLACGAGFYEGAIAATLLILLAELLFSKMEYSILATSQEISLYVEYTKKNSLDSIIHYLRSIDVQITDMEITRSTDENHKASVLFLLQANRRISRDDLTNGLSGLTGVTEVEEVQLA